MSLLSDRTSCGLTEREVREEMELRVERWLAKKLAPKVPEKRKRWPTPNPWRVNISKEAAA